LALQRQLRPNVYAIACRKPEPLIPLERTFEVTGRMSANGKVVTPLEVAELVAALESTWGQSPPEALAVCLMHSYVNPEHERRLRDALQERYPHLPIILSADILPTFREYERASTTAMAAYLAPLVGRYLSRLEVYLGQNARDACLFVMQSSGGLLPSGGARDRSVDMLNSGPAAGVMAAVRIAERVGDRHLITLDVGGTSSDVCLIANGRPEVTTDTEIDGLPVSRPTLDIVNVGAGGGSIGWIDSGGMLQVGPQSAGARPGPACYGHGGTVPTLTDALVELGWIRPERFLGGRMPLDRARARQALSTVSPAPGHDVVATAQAMVDIAVAHISRCVRLVSVQRGHDPKHYALYGYGGMGPAIAALAAQELKISRVVIPPYPGLFSALGLLVADLRRVYRETEFAAVDATTPERVTAVFARLMGQAREQFVSYGCDPEHIRWEYFLEMRHHGQGFELLVPIQLEQFARGGESYLRESFETVHRARYGTSAVHANVDIVTYRLVAEVPTAEQVLDRLTHPEPVSATVSRESSPILVAGKALECQFLARDSLPGGYQLDGPCVIEEPTATTLVPPGWTATVQVNGAILLELQEHHS
jgi:N-methylhydantoinase A